ncbi:unnamed protein product, partial [Polarella glacialis]
AEDLGAKRELDAITLAMTRIAAELRGSLLGLLPKSMPEPVGHDLAEAVATALPSLVAICADALDGGGGSGERSAAAEAAERAWAGEEASLLEAFPELADCFLSSAVSNELEQSEAGSGVSHFGGELPWLIVSGEDEAQDQAALSQILARLEQINSGLLGGESADQQSANALSDNLQTQSPWLLTTQALQPPGTAAMMTATSSSWADPSLDRSDSSSLAQLELQVQQLMAENQELEGLLVSRGESST